MAKLTKKFFWIAGALSAVVIILITSLVVAEIYINRESFINKIKVEASKAVDGKIDFEHLDLSILPRPMVAAEQGSISIPGVFEGSFEMLAVSPKFFPLLKGRLALDKVWLQSPSLKIVLPEISHRPEKEAAAFTVEGFEKALSEKLEKLVSMAPGLEASIKNGQVAIITKNREPFLLKSLNIDMALFPESVGLDIESSGNSWNKFVVKGRINPKDLKGRGRIEIEGIHPQILLQYFAPNAGKNIIESDLNLNIGFRTDGLKSFYGDIYSSGSSIILKNGKDRFDFKGEGMEGSVRITEDLTSFTIKEMNLGNPALSLAGKFVIGQNLLLESLDMTAKTGLEINAKDVDVNKLRALTLALAGDVKVVRGICDIVKGGRATGFSLRSLGKTMSDLGDFKNFQITGTMDNGEIFVPGAELDLTRVSGNVIIRDAILKGENLEAAFGKTTGKKGELKVGLIKGDAPFYLDVLLDADLAPLPSVLEKVVNNEPFLKELSQIETFNGNAIGKLVLNGTTRSMTTTVDVSKFSMAVKYGFLPFDIKAEGGLLAYSDTGVSYKDVAANIGQSDFYIQSAALSWKNKLSLAIETGKSTFVCKELVPWIESFYTLPDKIKTGMVIESPGIKLNWNEGAKTELSGEFKTDSGVNIVGDVAILGDNITIKKLALRDSESDTDMSFLIRPNEFSMGFKGLLTKSTLEKIFTENRFVDDRVEGDINIKVPVENLAGISAEGTLSGNKIKFTAGSFGEVYIKTVSIKGKQNNILIEKADLSWAGLEVFASGQIKTDKEGIELDIDVSSGVVIWEEIAKYFPEKENGSSKQNKWPPLNGTIRCKLKKFKIDDYVWKPAHADIAFDGFRTEVFIKKAVICGISTPGTITLSPEGKKVVFKPGADSLSVSESLRCLLGKEHTFTGTYSLDGHIYSRTESEDLVKSLAGNFDINARDGRIYTASLLGKILSVINISEIGEITTEGISYETMQAKGHIEDGRLIFDEGVLGGASINVTWNGNVDLKSNRMDIEMFVAPLSVLDIIAVPVRMTGSVDNPLIIPLSPSMVGSGLMNLMKKTVKLPFEVIEPVISGD